MASIRQAALEDAAAILDIYSHYILNTAITYEYEVPSLEEFRERMSSTMIRYPYLVIEEEGKILGYAYAGYFKMRAAYDWACELTIYLAPDARHGGLGKRLYHALEHELVRMGMCNLYACIAYPKVEDQYLTCNSADFHRHLGFTLCGRFHDCAYKFDTWYDMVWMEKVVGNHGAVAPLIPYPELRATADFSAL